jgi:hypothetical protein
MRCSLAVLTSSLVITSCPAIQVHSRVPLLSSHLRSLQLRGDFNRMSQPASSSGVSKMSPRRYSIGADSLGTQRTRVLLTNGWHSTDCDHNSHAVM